MDDLVVERVLRAVELVPPGTVVAYGDLAELVGIGPRQVGSIMATWGSGVAWWRVTNAAGSLPPELLARAREHWAAEGIALTSTGRVRIGTHRADLAALAADWDASVADLAASDPEPVAGTGRETNMTPVQDARPGGTVLDCGVMKADDLHREFRRQVRLSSQEVDPVYRREVAGLVRRLYPIDPTLTGATIESPEGLGESEAQIQTAITRQVTMFRERRQNLEWRTYGDDPPRDLPERLAKTGFRLGPTLVLMLGAARLLTDDAAVPPGVRVRSVEQAEDWGLLHETFDDGDPTGAAWTLDALRTEESVAPDLVKVALAQDSTTGQLLAISAVRLFAGTQFAHISAGFSLEQGQGRGISRALAARQAQVALDAGHPLLRLDVLPSIQPALGKRGMHGVTTTAVARLLVRGPVSGASGGAVGAHLRLPGLIGSLPRHPRGLENPQYPGGAA